MNNPLSTAVAILAAAALLAVGYGLGSRDGGAGDDENENKPLYWVAPMDPNYRRDGPGKSPMGMDLIPVYAEDRSGGNDAGPGAVSISPEVVNNLGVRTAKARIGRLPATIRTVGYVQYDEDRMAHIHSRVEGWIEKLHVKAAGDPVQRGAPLYDIYSPELVNAQEELLLAAGRDNARLLNAARSRLSALSFSKQSIDNLLRRRSVQRSVTMYAPNSGVVDNLQVREGFFVKPDMTMMGIAPLDSVWVVGEIFERQYSQVRVGDRVEMALDYLPQRRWQGQIDYIYPSLNQRTRTVQIRARFDNADRALKPNMYAQLMIDSAATEHAVLIPREALIRVAQQSRVVLALGDGRYKSIAVGVGRIGEREVQITDGLTAGDEVVVSAQFLLDSESSKSSDFLRMGDQSHSAQPDRVWVIAVVKTLALESNTLTLAHEPVPSWKWPAMTMDFSLQSGVATAELAEGQRIAILIERDSDNRYEVIDIAADGLIPENAAQGSSADKEDMDHSGMDHSGMDRSGMDRSGMDHGGAVEGVSSDDSGHEQLQ